MVRCPTTRRYARAASPTAPGDWELARERASGVLAFDADSEDALAFLEAANRQLDGGAASPPTRPPEAETARGESLSQPTIPTSFASGRYEVRRFLGEGGKKRVFLAHDVRLDRDIAFALIKTEGLDAAGRERIVREAQAMGRLGAHPHVVTIFEQGEEGGAPYVVNELLEGGDIEGELEAAGGPLSVERTLSIAKEICRGLEFARARSIVHRDVKPGNVWLTADGTAKIGDFGLAVSLGRSCLVLSNLRARPGFRSSVRDETAPSRIYGPAPGGPDPRRIRQRALKLDRAATTRSRCVVVIGALKPDRAHLVVLSTEIGDSGR